MLNVLILLVQISGNTSLVVVVLVVHRITFKFATHSQISLRANLNIALDRGRDVSILIGTVTNKFSFGHDVILRSHNSFRTITPILFDILCSIIRYALELSASHL